MKVKLKERGQSVALFAILMPIMSLFLLGILDYMVTNARVMETVAAADLAAHAGAQEITVLPDGTITATTAGNGIADTYFNSQMPRGERRSERGGQPRCTTACEGAVDAVRFLEAQGLDTSEHTQVDVVAALPTGGGPTAMGCYRHSERRLYVLTFGAFQKHGTFVGLPIDRVLHRSLITHEVAHAIAACNFAIPRPTIPAQEYLAYVAMFATMPEPHRTRALARFPGEGFRTEVAINLTIYQLSPDFFGSQAYRHFLAPGNGTSFLRQILSGAVLASDGLF